MMIRRYGDAHGNGLWVEANGTLVVKTGIGGNARYFNLSPDSAEALRSFLNAEYDKTGEGLVNSEHQKCVPYNMPSGEFGWRWVPGE